MKSKKKLILFIVTFILSIVMYSNFFPEYYSIDTTKIIKDGYMKYGINYSLYDGRIIMFLICSIAEIINIRIKHFNQILLISSLIISSISVLKIYSIIEENKTETNKRFVVLIYLISYCYIFNFMYIDCLAFAECLIMALSVLFYIKAAEEIICKSKVWKGLMFCILGVLTYQGTINTFMSTIVLLLLIAKKYNKSIIAIRPWGADMLPTEAETKADVIVNWQASSIVSAIREYSK